MTKKLLTILFLFLTFSLKAQYYEEHFIAPAPWQYWSTANEIVIGTIHEENVSVELKKSDGTLLTTLTVTNETPISYRFTGDPFSNELQRNVTGQTYTDRGLIIEASAPVSINLRNIASDATLNWFLTLNTLSIKGNASLVSFGNEAKGLEFRLGYYRESITGLFDNNAVYSVMATEDETEVQIPESTSSIVLHKGESRLFYAPIGSLLTSDKPVVMNVGSWGDTPQTCGMNGQDGTFDQIAPVHVLGTQYLVVRGDGTAPNASQSSLKYGSEQSLIVATQNNTIITIENFNPQGIPLGTLTTVTLTNAGDYYSFYHGDGIEIFSSSLINSTLPIIVYAGTAVGCETDISTVLPIGSCSGSTNIQTRKFIDFYDDDLPYFGFTIIESATEPVMIGPNNLETITGTTRIALGDSGFYILTFNNAQISQPDILLLSSNMPLTTSLVQQGEGFSMSAFFSAFGEVAKSPILVSENENCTLTIKAEESDLIFKYEWFLDGISLGETDDNILNIEQSGEYTVRVLKACGWGNISLPTNLQIAPCSDLKITKEIDEVENGTVVFKITVTNLGPIFSDSNIIIDEQLPNGYEFINAVVTSGTYNSIDHIWEIPTLAVSEVETLFLTAKILSNGEYNNIVTIQGTNMDPNLANNSAEEKIIPDSISFTKIAEEAEYHDIDQALKYTMHLKNIGQNPIKNIKITDDNADHNSIFPNTISILNPGEEIVITASHTITESEYRSKKVINQAIATADAVTGKITVKSDDPSTIEFQDPTITYLNRAADIQIVKDNFQHSYLPGSETEYHIIIKNNGPTSSIDLTINDPLPNGITDMFWISETGDSGQGDLHFTIPLLRVNEEILIKSVFKIPSEYQGDLTNIVSYTSEIFDPNPECPRCIDIDIEKAFIPKGISPNGDYKNDRLNLERYHIENFQIFNRYGAMVFQKKNYLNEWVGQNSQGELLPTGVYYYVITIKTGENLSGWIQLIY